jgi:acyl carrier protein
MYVLLQIVLMVVIVIVAAIPFVRLRERWRRKKIEEVFADRQRLDERAFYERYFQSRGIPFFVVSKVRAILEEELRTDLSRLSAGDDFKKNLSFFWQYDSMADDEIVSRLEEEFNIKITDVEAGKTNTVDDLVNLVWLKVQQRTA